MDILVRIQVALEAAVRSISQFFPGPIEVQYKSDKDPVTEADRTIDRVLREALLKDGEGWLSEESTDDSVRLRKEHVWIVDPLDGTREFIAGIPEWCISIGFVENGIPVAAGICNPATGEVFLGARGRGITRNGHPVRPSACKSLSEITVLASRSEMTRGDWDCCHQCPFVIRPVGSVAYKLALVAAGIADATWTLFPKHEWDVAGGVALVEIAGGFAQHLEGSTLGFNNVSTLIPGLVAGGPHLRAPLTSWLREHGGLRSPGFSKGNDDLGTRSLRRRMI
jgi:myo-inositol-1(or 4)-monophosphatase